MLAVATNMEPPRSSLIREPSAEDLDAAHQLVSSARGAREASLTDPKRPQTTSDTSAQAPASPESLPSGDGEPAPESIARSVPRQSQGQPESYPQVSPSLGQACSNCGTTRTPLWRRSPTGSTICNACGLYLKARNTARPVKNPAAAAATTSQPPVEAVSGRSNYESSQEPAASQASPSADGSYVAPEHTSGSCPGGGSCNGAGGSKECAGCPALNNRVSKSQSTASSAPAEGSPQSYPVANGQQRSVETVVACQNCMTTVTPLWRRDEQGHTICNACGLYYKLHGAHRPVSMKKPTIKRRRRVVPAAREVSPTATKNTSLSPEPRHHMPSIDSVPLPTRPNFNNNPPPVDFTGWRSNQQHPFATPPPSNTSESNFLRTSRKRSISATTDTPDHSAEVPPAARNSISSILNPQSQTQQRNIHPEEPPVDPSLVSISQNHKSSPSPAPSSRSAINSGSPKPGHESEAQKALRRAQLLKEAEDMREMLRRKEMELAELD